MGFHDVVFLPLYTSFCTMSLKLQLLNALPKHSNKYLYIYIYDDKTTYID